MILIKDTFYENEITDIAVTEIGINKVHRTPANPDMVIDGADTIALRGVVDVHTHLRFPGFGYKEDLYSGYRAAIAGGFAAVCCEPNTMPVIDNTETLAEFYEAAQNLSPLLLSKAAVTVNENGEMLNYLKALYNGGAVMFSDDGEPIVDEELLVEAFQRTANISVTNPPVITAHCEETPRSSNHVRKVMGYNFDKFDMEVEIIKLNIRALYMAKAGRLHIQHVSKKESLKLIKEAKDIGLNITAEVTPHHLLLCNEDFDESNTNFKINPPLRSREDMMAMRKGLNDGIINMVATDHAPHSISEKMEVWKNAPFGGIGLQTALGAVYGLVASGELGQERFIKAFTIEPQRLLPVEKRELVSNSVTLLKTNKEWDLNLYNNYSHSINSPFWEKKLAARPVAVIIAGKPYMLNETVLF